MSLYNNPPLKHQSQHSRSKVRKKKFGRFLSSSHKCSILPTQATCNAGSESTILGRIMQNYIQKYITTLPNHTISVHDSLIACAYRYIKIVERRGPAVEAAGTRGLGSRKMRRGKQPYSSHI